MSNSLYMLQTHCVKYRINTFWCQLDKRSYNQALLYFISIARVIVYSIIINSISTTTTINMSLAHLGGHLRSIGWQVCHSLTTTTINMSLAHLGGHLRSIGWQVCHSLTTTTINMSLAHLGGHLRSIRMAGMSLAHHNHNKYVTRSPWRAPQEHSHGRYVTRSPWRAPQEHSYVTRSPQPQ